jgi:hypothetical protein
VASDDASDTFRPGTNRRSCLTSNFCSSRLRQSQSDDTWALSTLPHYPSTYHEVVANDGHAVSGAGTGAAAERAQLRPSGHPTPTTSARRTGCVGPSWVVNSHVLSENEYSQSSSRKACEESWPPNMKRLSPNTAPAA